MKRINLALQGGGAHGAFTWGVLDRLLEEDDIEIAAISGTSAGAMNGAALKSGLITDGRSGARACLDWFWEQMGATGDLRLPDWMAQGTPWSNMVNQMAELSPAYLMGEAMRQVVSPYAYGPFYQNPLERIVRQFEYGQVCAGDGPQLFVGATNVHSGKIRIFKGNEITPEALLASACLPTMFQAVEIDDEHYWDGGYAGNPALFPLFAKDLPDDIMIININPLERPEVPKSPQDIQNRINEISFNSSLLRELRAIDFVQRLLDQDAMEQGAMKRVNVHMIADDDLMRNLSVATKLLPTPNLLHQLKEAGRAAADVFLDQHSDDLNQRSSTDLEEMFA
ncbi:patatin-like phospholipase family protein [Roseovarius sp. EL26]|uniref:patatin-like phospholipase family protein n=1 Tax=Roseovarius sp. EL26 TaxID=2126672 RepID=UPI000EA12794|nr:patatin-like phospholipase family protein [Roseovarius sp. EL26]